MKKTILLIAAAAIMMACTKQEPADETVYRGADFGWLTEMEHDSMPFFNDADQQVDCITLFQEAGMNAVRLRVWVNHQTGWSNLPDVLGVAKRVHAAGLPLMIDFHYSDFFADPQRQDIPEAWRDLNLDEMCLAVGAHTTEVLEALKAEGIEPKWVQIGNETTNGMLWPMAQLDPKEVKEEAYRNPEIMTLETRPEWQIYARLSNSGYEAAKQVFPDVICIIHVDNAFIPRVNWFRRFQAEGGKWDMIGLSHYPFTQDTLTWAQMNDLCKEDVMALHEAFRCPVMVVEIGCKTEWQPEESELCIADYLEKMKDVEGYAGVFYWEPEVYGNWRPAEYIPLGWGSYDMGCMTKDGHLSNAAKLLYNPNNQSNTQQAE